MYFLKMFRYYYYSIFFNDTFHWRSKTEVNLERWVWPTPFLLLPSGPAAVFGGQKSESKLGGKSIFITNINTWYEGWTFQG